MRHIYTFLLLTFLIKSVLLKNDGELYDPGRSTLINLNPMKIKMQKTDRKSVV